VCWTSRATQRTWLEARNRAESQNSSSSNYHVPHPSFLIHYHSPTIYQFNTTNHQRHHYNHHTSNSNHNRHTTFIQPSHIQLHRQTKVRAGNTHTTTAAVICCDMQFNAIAMHMLCDMIMQPINTLALYLAMSSLP